MEHWTSVVKGRSNTCAVVGNKIFGWNARTFKLHKEIRTPITILFNLESSSSLVYIYVPLYTFFYLVLLITIEKNTPKIENSGYYRYLILGDAVGFYLVSLPQYISLL